MSKAEFSECGTYRYTLTRDLPCILRWERPALFIMLNPSTADEINNDPTIRRCISFAEKNFCTKLTVVNLFALRSPDPKVLKAHSKPVGPLNDEKICQSVFRNKAQNGIIVAAWGSHPFAKDRAKEIEQRFGPFMCLGRTKNGSPKHPLYVPEDTELVKYEP